MHDLHWKKPDDHPPLEFLLLHLDGGLDGEDRDAVAKHLCQCWTCMTDVESMKAGIRSFMELRARVLPAVPLDPRASRVRRALLDAAREGTPPHSPRFLVRFENWIAGLRLRPSWIAGAVSAVLLAYLLFVSVAIPPRLMGGEFLKKAQTSIAERRDRDQRKVVYQEVQVRRGTSVARRKIVRGLADAVAVHQGPAPAWTAILAGPLTWDDPLDLESFLKWRAMQTVRSEQIADAPGFITLTTRTSGPAKIREASITVRRIDWHIVAKQVEMADGPAVEATEIAYEVRDLPLLGASGNAASSNVPSRNRDAGAREPDVSRLELDEAEIRVRSLLFRLGAGLGEEEVPPSAYRSKSAITVQGVISSAERRRRLESELASIPNTRFQVADRLPPVPSMEESSGVPDSPGADSTAMETHPPLLREMLIRRLGTEMAATDFSNRALSASRKLFSLAVQYHELSKRYTRTEMEGLSPDVSERVLALVRAMEQSIAQEMWDQDELLKPLLGHRSRPVQAEPRKEWQDRADRAFELASAHDRILSVLFAVTSGKTPDEQDPNVILRELDAIRGDLTGVVGPLSGDRSRN
jgi:hypothetical protein